MYFVILTGTSARIAIASETEKKREASISHSNHQWPCSRENNLALLQDKLDSPKHLNEKTKYIFTRLFRQLYILDRFLAN